MTKNKRAFAITDSIRYKQTDISTYFKIKGNGSSVSKMKLQQSSTNKENDSEELLLSPRKQARPIASDDETESEDFLTTPASASTIARKRKSVLQEYQLPLRLPSYACSEDTTDTEVCSDSNVLFSQNVRKIHRKKKRMYTNSQPLPSVTCAKECIAEKSDIKKQPIVIISSDEEDFVETPRKIKKFEKLVVHDQKLTASETKKKVEKYLENASSSQQKTRRQLYKTNTASSVNKQKQRNTEDKGALCSNESSPKNSSSLPNPTTSATLTEAEKLLSIGVHRPTVIPTQSEKRKPRILEQKSKSNGNLSFINPEFISTDFTSTSATLKILSTAVCDKDSNSTLICEQNISFGIGEGMHSTPNNKIKVLGNVILTSPQINVSPMKEGIKTNNTTINKQSFSVGVSPKKSPINRTLKFKSEKKQDTCKLSVQGNEEAKWNPFALRLFTKIVEHNATHCHLKTMLTGRESDMLNRFFKMPSDTYRFLCLKLFTRIQKWYNIFKLKDTLKIEMSELEVKNMYICLYENGFVEKDFSREPCTDLLNTLLLNDIKDLCESFKIKTATLKKPEMVEKLLTNCNRQTTLTFQMNTEGILRERIKKKMGFCVKLNPILSNLFYKVHLLYTFTSSDFQTINDLYLFLSKIESEDILMPQCPINKNIEIFSSIEQFSKFSVANECKQSVLQSIDKKEIGYVLELCEMAYTALQKIFTEQEVQKPSYLMRFTAGHKYTRALSAGSKYLARHYPDKVKDWLTFLIHQDRYSLQARGLWFDMLIMVQYHYLKQHETAAETIIKALNTKDLSDVALHELSYRAEAIKRSKTHKISELQKNTISFAQPAVLREIPFIEITAHAVLGNESGSKRRYIEKREGERHFYTVEETAMKHYCKKDFANGVHCEGSLLNTIFFVLFWDIIYESAVPDAFILEIQYFPLDLFSPEFYTNRKEEIDRRLKEIKSQWPYDQLKGFVCKTWREHAEKKSSINTELVDEPSQLYDIILCIGRVKLASMLERMVKNLKLYHSGLPDLFLWNVKQKKCKFVEVKGEKDKLSTKQKLWLDFLLSVGADAEVCHVRTIGSRATIKGTKMKSEMKK